MTIRIDPEKCIGCGACVAVAPSCFKVGTDGKAQIKERCKCNEDCRLAMSSCPVGAISRVLKDRSQ